MCRFSGGIYIRNAGAYIVQNVIKNNNAVYGAGIYAYCSTGTFKQNTIESNITVPQYPGDDWRGDGGGLYIGQGWDLSLEENKIINNTAQTGGGVYITNGKSVSIVKNFITRRSLIFEHKN